MANILVVDDEIGIRELLSEILSDEGHAVETAENAQQANAHRLAKAPDLVLLDIWMPDKDGVTLLKEWQANQLLTMPVVMMSGHATIDTAVEATRIGAINFLEKPISMQKLLRTVQQALNRSREIRSSIVPMRSLPFSPTEKKFEDGETRLPANHPAAEITPQNLNSWQPILAQELIFLANLSFDLPLREARDAFERVYFEHHLIRENGSMTRVAERTGLERTHLYRKLKQLGVEPSKITKRGE